MGCFGALAAVHAGKLCFRVSRLAARLQSGELTGALVARRAVKD